MDPKGKAKSAVTSFPYIFMLGFYKCISGISLFESETLVSFLLAIKWTKEIYVNLDKFINILKRHIFDGSLTLSATLNPKSCNLAIIEQNTKTYISNKENIYTYINL